MDSFFEILIYIVVFGFVILANIRKSRQKSQSQQDPLFEPVEDIHQDIYPTVKEEQPAYVAYEPKVVPDVKAQLLARMKERKESAPQPKVAAKQTKSGIQNSEIKSLTKNTDNQKKAQFDIRKAIVFSTIIHRPYD
jgi:hypothetical protein